MQTTAMRMRARVPQQPFGSRAMCRRAPAQRRHASLADAPMAPLMEKGELVQFPDEPGVYAVYNADKELQYIGLSRKVSASVSNHMQELPDLTHAVKYELVPSASREALTDAWKAWVQDAINELGTVPPGNLPGETKWQARTVRVRPEVKLTAGKAINVPMETLIDQVVQGNKVVAFVKGTRQSPQCGFSYKMLTLLNDSRVEYEVVNVLDDFHNPGLRDAIKTYSAWPTIPQLYVGGEFVGGSDICEQMTGNGELQELLRKQ